MTAYASLAALTAEHSIQSQARMIKTTPVYYSLEQLQAIAASTIPAARKAKVESVLAEIFGERPVPPSEYLDMMFGLDMVINYRGWIIGIDVTLNAKALAAKQSKQRYLSDAYGPNGLGLDKWAVVLAPCPDLKAELSAIIRG